MGIEDGGRLPHYRIKTMALCLAICSLAVIIMSWPLWWVRFHHHEGLDFLIIYLERVMGIEDGGRLPHYRIKTMALYLAICSPAVIIMSWPFPVGSLPPPQRFELPDNILGAGDGNRTHVTSLGSWGSTIELHPHK